MESIVYRKAEKKDIPDMLSLIKELAAYEHLEHEAKATVEDFEKWMFDEKKVYAFMAELDGKNIGMAIYFYNFSTWLGKCGLYLEDLYVKPEYRGKGYGKGLLKTLAKEAHKEGLGRLEWACLDWNKPSIDFYLSMDATPMDEWTVYRLTGDTLEKAAK